MRKIFITCLSIFFTIVGSFNLFALDIDTRAIILVVNGNCMTSGVIINIETKENGNRIATILSCAHGKQNSKTYLIYQNNQKHFEARMLEYSPFPDKNGNDFCILQAFLPENYPSEAFIPLGLETPKAGEKIEFYGYPYNTKKLTKKEGYVKGYITYKTIPSFKNWMVFTPVAVSGDSGGPVIYNNTVVGIVSSAGKVDTIGPNLIHFEPVCRRIFGFGGSKDDSNCTTCPTCPLFPNRIQPPVPNPKPNPNPEKQEPNLNLNEFKREISILSESIKSLNTRISILEDKQKETQEKERKPETEPEPKPKPKEPQYFWDLIDPREIKKQK